LEESQDELASLVTMIMKHGYFPIILGGGHEVSFGAYKGVFRSHGNDKPEIGIINFDAHFDLRDYSEGASSGTPFLQIADLCSSNIKFNYLCLGIQAHVNTRNLFKKAMELNVSFVQGDELTENDVPQIKILIQNFLKETDSIYLTIDLDVFDMTDAPGVSAPAMPGADKRVVLKLLKTILESGKVAACDIAEMNPRFDVDNRTAKLAAYLVFTMLSSYREF